MIDVLPNLCSLDHTSYSNQKVVFVVFESCGVKTCSHVPAVYFECIYSKRCMQIIEPADLQGLAVLSFAGGARPVFNAVLEAIGYDLLSISELTC